MVVGFSLPPTPHVFVQRKGMFNSPLVRKMRCDVHSLMDFSSFGFAGAQDKLLLLLCGGYWHLTSPGALGGTKSPACVPVQT